MMKRVILLILAMLMVLSVLAACGNKDQKNAESAPAATEAVSLKGAESPEAAVQQYIDGQTERDADKFCGVLYGANFGKDKTYEEYVEKFNNMDYDAYMIERMKKMTYTVTSKEEWDADRVKEAAEQLAYVNNDTDKITAMADITYASSGDAMEPQEYKTTAIRCDGRWYLME